MKQKRDDFLRKARDEIVAGGTAEFSARELAMRTGFTPSFVSRRIGDKDRIYRRVMLDWLSELAELAPKIDSAYARPSAAVEGAASALADFFACDAYRRFLSVIIRTQSESKWLCDRHRKTVLAPLEYRIYSAIRASGENLGLSLEVRSHGIADFIDRLETAFALEPLKPHIGAWHERRSAVARAQSTKELIENIYEGDALLHAA